jgi:sugar-specific transcriptional regulator TrmB
MASKTILKEIEEKLQKGVRDLSRAVERYDTYLDKLEKKYGHLGGFKQIRQRLSAVYNQSVTSVAACITQNQGFDEAADQLIDLHRTSKELAISKSTEEVIGRRRTHRLDKLSHKIGNRCAPVIGWVETLEQEREELKQQKTEKK